MIKLVKTEDGSHTLLNEKFGVHYHSIFGAIQESKHIFIEAGLVHQSKYCSELNILEVGFGTGLNALLSMGYAKKTEAKINYFGIEAYPVSEELIAKLNYHGLVEDINADSDFKLIHQHDWGQPFNLNAYFNLEKVTQKIESIILPANQFNLVYFDAFAPDIQPELWTGDVFEKIYNAMTEGGVLVTYSVKGVVKRALKSAGFQLEKLPGPIGKREFLRAIKPIH